MGVHRNGRQLAPETAEQAVLVSRTTEISQCPIQVFLHEQETPRTLWAEPEEPIIATGGTAATITANGRDRFQAVQTAASRVFEDRDVDRSIPHAARPRLFGGLAFHDDHTDTSPWEGFPAARFDLPAVQLTHMNGGTLLTVNAYSPEADPVSVERELAQTASTLDTPARASPSGTPGVSAIHRIPSKETWHEQVRTALDRISVGTLQKVVLAQSLEAQLNRPIDFASMLKRLGNRYPECTRFLFAPTEAACAFGATPERLISRRGRTVETEALAGSIGRGETPTEDEALAKTLAESNKDRHEHVLVRDAIQDQLEPLASSVTTGPRVVKRLVSVQHLQTTIRARLTKDRHVLSLVEALHPTPAVGGVPPAAAQETIRATESFDRGWYAAPVGWFDGRGNGAFAVAIRSAVANDQLATLFAGAGIVADSDPETEWEEVQLKYRPILDALTS